MNDMTYVPLVAVAIAALVIWTMIRFVPDEMDKENL